MLVTRAIRKAVSRLLIGVLLFAQLAVASYACPGLSGMSSTTAAGATSWAPVQAATEPSTSVAGCEHIDANAANLCAAHCQHGQQSADTAPVPVVYAAIPTFLYSLPIEPEHLLGSGRSYPAPDASLAAAPPPPHAILHCVFRT